MLGVVIGEEPERDRGDQHRRGIDLRHHLPAEHHHQRGGHELGDRGARVAGTEHAHREPLVLTLEPARAVGDADREGAAGEADEEAGDEELPVLGGVADEVDRQYGAQHQHEEDDATAVLVGEHAERQANQRARQHRGGREQAELGLVEGEDFLDRDPDHREQHPDSKTNGESGGAHHEHGHLLKLASSHFPLRSGKVRRSRFFRGEDRLGRRPAPFAKSTGSAIPKEVRTSP